jgi:hypothetical protein
VSPIPWVRLAIYVGCVLVVLGLLKGCHDSLVAKGAQQERARWTERDRQAQEQAAKETQRRLDHQETSNRETRTRMDAADAARRRSDAAAGSLRDDLATADAERRRNSAALTQCAAAEAAVDLRDRLFRGADDTAGELASYAQAARIAGEQCERDSDALRGGK